jgi:hypothetical protein
MLLGRNPYMAITPYTKRAELLDFRVVGFAIILYWEPCGIKDASITAQSK